MHHHHHHLHHVLVHVVLLVILYVQIPYKIHHITQLPCLSLLTRPPEMQISQPVAWFANVTPTFYVHYPPCFSKFWSDFPLLVINPIPTSGTILPSSEWRTFQVKNEAVVVIRVAAVHPLHVGSGLLVVNSVGWVGGEETLPTDLTLLKRISLCK
jgi:hypothetical protein